MALNPDISALHRVVHIRRTARARNRPAHPRPLSRPQTHRAASGTIDLRHRLCARHRRLEDRPQIGSRLDGRGQWTPRSRARSGRNVRTLLSRSNCRIRPHSVALVQTRQPEGLILLAYRASTHRIPRSAWERRIATGWGTRSECSPSPVYVHAHGRWIAAFKDLMGGASRSEECALLMADCHSAQRQRRGNSWPLGKASSTEQRSVYQMHLPWPVILPG